jgi:hypothetical protein
LQEFIRTYVPSFRAAQILVFVATNRDRDFSAAEVVDAMRFDPDLESTVKDYLAFWNARHLLTETGGRFVYRQASDHERAIEELRRSYRERPVTLTTAIYLLASSQVVAETVGDALRVNSREERGN